MVNIKLLTICRGCIWIRRLDDMYNHFHQLIYSWNTSCYQIMAVLSQSCLVAFYYIQVFTRMSHGIYVWSLVVVGTWLFRCPRRNLTLSIRINSANNSNSTEFLINSNIHLYNTKNRVDCRLPLNSLENN